MTWLFLPVGLGVGVLAIAWLIYRVWWSRVVAGDGAYGTIEGYVGRPGQGKTTLAVQDCIGRARLRNAYLVSNVPIVAEGLDCLLVPVTEDGLDVGWLVALALRCRREGRGIVLFLDEVGVWMPARMWAQFGIALMWLLQQSRKLTVEMRWTAQSVKFVDGQLRELTAAVHAVHAVPPSTVARRMAGRRPWWINVSSYTDADHVGSDDYLGGSSRSFYRQAWEGAFDTDAMVLPPAKLKGAQALLDAIRAAIADEGGDPALLAQAETVFRSA